MVESGATLLQVLHLVDRAEDGAEGGCIASRWGLGLCVAVFAGIAPHVLVEP